MRRRRWCAWSPTATGPTWRRCGWLARIDPQLLDDADRVDLIRAWERCRAMLDGAQQRGAVSRSRTRPRAAGWPRSRPGTRSGPRCGCPRPTAGERTWVATSLRRRLPAALAALQAGDIAYLQAAHLVAAVRELDRRRRQPRSRPGCSGRAPDQTAGGVQARRSRGRCWPSTRPRPRTGTRRRPRPGPSSGCRSRTAMESCLADHAGAGVEGGPVGTLTAGRRGRPRPTGSWPGLGRSSGSTRCGSTPWSHAVLGNGGANPHHDPRGTMTHRPPAATEDIRDDSPGTASPRRRRRRRLPGQVRPPRLPRCRCGGAQTAAVVIDLPTLLALSDRPGEIPGYGPIPAPAAKAMAARPGLGPLAGRPRHRRPARPRRRAAPAVGPAAPVHRRPGPPLRVPRLLQTGPRPMRLRPRGHLHPPRPDDHRQPGSAVPAAPQRQDPRPLATQLRPRHQDQDLDQPLGAYTPSAPTHH